MAGQILTLSQSDGTAVAAPSAFSGINTVASADYTITDTDGYGTILVSTGASNRTVTLPTVADNTGRRITIKKTDSGTGYLILDGESAETIDGQASLYIAKQYSSLTVQSDGSTWQLVVDKTVGEKVTAEVSSGSAVSLTTATVDTVVAITVPPGRWVITGTAAFTGTATAANTFICGVDVGTETIPDALDRHQFATAINISTADYIITFPPYHTATLTTNTDHAVTARATFASGTVAAYGRITAIRVAAY